MDKYQYLPRIPVEYSEQSPSHGLCLHEAAAGTLVILSKRKYCISDLTTCKLKTFHLLKSHLGVFSTFVSATQVRRRRCKSVSKLTE